MRQMPARGGAVEIEVMRPLSITTLRPRSTDESVIVNTSALTKAVGPASGQLWPAVSAAPPASSAANKLHRAINMTFPGSRAVNVRRVSSGESTPSMPYVPSAEEGSGWRAGVTGERLPELPPWLLRRPGISLGPQDVEVRKQPYRLATPGKAPERRVDSVPVAAREHCGDRKSTRLNSSHLVIPYAVFC